MFPGSIKDMLMISGTAMQAVQIPAGATWVDIILQGAGGGGGGGATGDTTVNRGGGGGAAGGNRARLITRARFLPGTLYIQNGAGGAGGAAGSSGSNPGGTLILPEPAYATFNAIMTHTGGGFTAAGGGSTSAGTSGSGSPIGAAGNFGSSGIYSCVTASSGTAGGLGAVGTQLFISNVVGTAAPGSGGGGHSTTPANFAGGAFNNTLTGLSLIPTQPGGASGGGNGLDAIAISRYMLTAAATGGGSNHAGTGGKGGDGIYGSGGGGGGSGATGGAGGKGGDGFVLIGWW